MKRRRPALFSARLLDLTTGTTRRASRAELATAYRLWAAHSDIRLGRVKETRRA